MDLLKPEDRAFLHSVLVDCFEPLGATDRFLVVAIGKDSRGFVCQLRADGSEPVGAMDLLRAVSTGTVTDEFTIGKHDR